MAISIKVGNCEFNPYRPMGECVHLVIDLETMGTDVVKGFPVTQMGAAYMDVNGDMQTFSMNIDSDECIALGYKPSDSTLEWMMTQPEEIVNSWFTNPRPVKEGLEALTRFIHKAASHASENGMGFNIWGHSPVFDMLALARLYSDFDLTCPWSYQIERDLRTLLAAVPLSWDTKSAIEEEAQRICGFGIHNACYDAVYEATCIELISLKLKELDND